MDYKENDRLGWSSRIPLPGNPKVSFVVAAYKRPMQIMVTLSSILSQSHQNFEIIVVHDGPDWEEVKKSVDKFEDDRIKWHVMPENMDDFGNSSKEYGSTLATGDYIGHSNDDNYYAPVYFEWVLSEMINKDAQFGYCNMAHSNFGWDKLECAPQQCRIDGGGWLCEADIVKATPWGNKKFCTADGVYVENLVSRCRNTVRVDGILFVHN
jgi:glycosyltransferase involved in cell wall biosynthesis